MQALFALLSLKFFQKAIGMSHVIEKFNSSTMYQYLSTTFQTGF